MERTLLQPHGSAGEFTIRQFRPATIPSPLTSVRFVSDHDTVLLDPSRYDPTQETGSTEQLQFSSDPSTSATPEETPPASPSARPAALAALAFSHAQQQQNVKIQLAGARRKLFFDPATVTAGLVTCGGVCPGLNDVIRALVNVLYHRYGVQTIWGFRYGFQGLASKEVQPIRLHPDSVKDIHQFGGTILGSSRGPQDPKRMVDGLVERGVNMLFCIGGDGTQKGALAIANEVLARELTISVIGIGKTIDNDLLYLDRSFGFETAVQLAQQPLIAGHEEARSSKNGIGIVKLMGRESGAIALHASLASGDVNVLLVPEVKFSIEALVEYLRRRFQTRDHCLIVCAEGAGQDLMGDSGKRDASGNRQFNDIGLFLKKEIGARLSELKVEHSIKYIDPSYTIRAGVTNASDATLCVVFAQMAAHAAMAGKTAMMVGLIHGQFVHLPLAKVVQGKKNVDIKGLYWQAFCDATDSPFVQQPE